MHNLGFSPDDLADAIKRGWVTRRTLGDVAIYNYSPAATYDRTHNWPAVTRACRGLVMHTGDALVGPLLARPFPKFFNHGQAYADHIDLDEPVWCADKADGSLGVMWASGCVATRGSLDSPQANHARAWLAAHAPRYEPPWGLTPLFEIIYPDNRIVCDYGDTDALVLLGAVDMSTGASVRPDDPRLAAWPGPRVELLPYTTLREALAAPNRPGAEGMVVTSADGLRRVKLKQPDYVALHKVLAHLSNHAVWEALAKDLPTSMRAAVPASLVPWVERTIEGLREAHARAAQRDHDLFVACGGSAVDRKTFALAALAASGPKGPSSALFALYTGNLALAEAAWWREVEPTVRVMPTRAAAED